MRSFRKIKNNLLILLSVIGLAFAGCNISDLGLFGTSDNVKVYDKNDRSIPVDIKDVPKYRGIPYVEINDNKPSFSEKDKDRVEEYSKLDKLGRCGPAFANVGKELMPTSPRESIRDVRPSGWHTVKYDDILEDRYLYNRCHLIAFMLAGENANERNLITGTRYFNVEGMLPFEIQVADYVKSTGNHVLYRVRPIFKGNDLVARGVQMEAQSVEDGGEGISFNVYCYNVQPGIRINYKDGSSQPESKVQKNKNKNKNKKPYKSNKTKKARKKYGMNVFQKDWYITELDDYDISFLDGNSTSKIKKCEITFVNIC
ncbi:DNA/RNA non-specific endonuclease [Catonella massiliensis]|jgi:hypothetical protein|uniref:DNA/RNA non-specific endonuclease n=1 Tax=Catonella massiliensis TaxID=2799636 RepID=A0ABS1J0Z2_9FIRM|nr:DNA/RNA non-specific endonuclease [Catonella massiliensis]MBK5897670.1 DNA/RNA non-specific endonuclease [Catonella massiliensis]